MPFVNIFAMKIISKTIVLLTLVFVSIAFDFVDNENSQQNLSPINDWYSDPNEVKHSTDKGIRFFNSLPDHDLNGTDSGNDSLSDTTIDSSPTDNSSTSVTTQTISELYSSESMRNLTSATTETTTEETTVGSGVYILIGLAVVYVILVVVGLIWSLKNFCEVMKMESQEGKRIDTIAKAMDRRSAKAKTKPLPNDHKLDVASVRSHIEATDEKKTDPNPSVTTDKSTTETEEHNKNNDSSKSSAEPTHIGSKV